MTRRAAAHDYTQAGIYHITMHVADGLGQPLSHLVGSEIAPADSPDAPRTELTAIGRMMEQELLQSISGHYAMITVMDYVVMPDHLHFLLEVHDKILSRHGKTLSLGHVIAGFKKGCNKRYWALTGQAAPNGASSGSSSGTGTGGSSGSSGSSSGTGTGGGTGETAAHAGNAEAGLPGAPTRPYKVPSNGTTGRQPLFAPGFCDVMPVNAAQLATQRQYIKEDPRYRLLRSRNRDRLTAQRGTVGTALTPAALRKYLLRECGPHQATGEVLTAIESRLLLTNGIITCDSYGDRALLSRRLLPVVCHRRDRALLARQKARCLEEAAQGTVLVSARIAKGEQEIIDDCMNHGFPVILIADNGFPDRYHPSMARTDLVSARRLLLVSPWQYQYRGKNEQVTVPFCKVMNCVAQALCRTKDDWWKTTN